MNLFNILHTIHLSGLLDMFFMSILIYAILVWFKNSKAAFVLMGIFIVGALYLVAHQMNMILTQAVFQGFFAVSLVAVIVIFQEEIKHFFERIAVWSLNRGLKRYRPSPFGRREIDILVRSVTDLARDKIGALIVLKGRDIIVRHLDGGTDLNGELSEPILKSLFDPHSDGHDGALIIDGGHITQFSCHLPLSKDLNKINRSGTRHAAALGLAELSDAFCIVVSEEMGTISVARHGEIETVNDPEKLTQRLQVFYEEIFPTEQRSLKGFFTRNFKEKVLAVVITTILWFMLAYDTH